MKKKSDFEPMHSNPEQPLQPEILSALASRWERNRKKAYELQHLSDLGSDVKAKLAASQRDAYRALFEPIRLDLDRFNAAFSNVVQEKNALLAEAIKKHITEDQTEFSGIQIRPKPVSTYQSGNLAKANCRN